MISTKRIFTPVSVLAVLSLSYGSASAAPPPFCPAPGTPTVCAGRQVGDLLITDRGSPLVLGLNPGSGNFYAFSSFNDPPLPAVFSSVELGSIVVEPSNPLHSLVIGDVTNGGIGLEELDDCGAVTAAPWGTFVAPQFPPPGPADRTSGLNGLNARELAFNPLLGNLLIPDVQALVFSFPSAGGNDTVLFGTGDSVSPGSTGGAATDEAGNFYAGGGSPSGGQNIVKYTSATLATPTPTGTFLLAATNTLQSIRGIVSDADGSLFVTDFAPGAGKVWKVDATSGAATVWASGLSGPKGITIDANGDLWIVEEESVTGVAKISGTTGQLLQFFALPSLVVGTTAGVTGNFPTMEPTGIAVLGVNLPASRKDCATPNFPTIATAIDAATGPANVNPSALTDSYRSCEGAYGGANVSSHGDVEAGQTITVNSGATVHGNRIPNTPSGLTPMPLPAGIVSRGDLNVNGAVTLQAGDYLYDNININGSAGSLRGAGGLVRIWYRNSFNVGGNVTAANNLPANLWFFGLAGSGPANVNSRVNFVGVIDSPTASVSLNSGSVLFGALVGSQVTLNGGVVHFDQVIGGATCP